MIEPIKALSKHSTERLSNKKLDSATVWSVVGEVSPMFVAICTIPPTLHALGNERFGLLALVWALVGYFTLFDFGLGRALTRFVADRLDRPEANEIRDLIRTALITMACLGGIAGFILWFSGEAMIVQLTELDPALEREARAAVHLVAFSLPVVVLVAGLRGILQAQMAFRSIASTQIIFGVGTYALPFCMTIIGIQNVSYITATLVALRAFIFYRYAHEVYLRLPAGNASAAGGLASMLRYGGWLTVSNIVGPIMVYSDRFLIGTVLGPAAIAIYTIPFDLASRALVLPSALVSVGFPAFAAASSDPLVVSKLFRRISLQLATVTMPAVLFTLLLASELLEWWIDPSFSLKAGSLLVILSGGIYLNGLARLPHALLQACGRADLTALIHLFELPLYLIALWWAVSSYGLIGAASVWTLRAALDLVLLSCCAGWQRPEVLASIMQLLGIAGVLMALTVLASIPNALEFINVTARCSIVAIAIGLAIAILGIGRKI